MKGRVLDIRLALVLVEEVVVLDKALVPLDVVLVRLYSFSVFSDRCSPKRKRKEARNHICSCCCPCNTCSCCQFDCKEGFLVHSDRTRVELVLGSASVWASEWEDVLE
jgi:hypothetical protein